MERVTGGVAGMLISLFTIGVASGAITVATSSGADVLAGEIVGIGSDIVSGSVVYAGAPMASGLFTGGMASGMGMDAGVILTSGNAALAQGGNTTDTATGANGLAGDMDLNAMLPAGRVTCDATVLEFDFTSPAGTLFFNYVFASDEYNEYVNTSYNDVFGIFLDGSNVALIGGTDTAVSIDTVNGGGPAFGTNASHPELFHNNDLDDGGPFFDFSYDGFTHVFGAEIPNLAAGTHHVKFAIADTGDALVDSALFIQRDSFVVQSPPAAVVPAPGPLLLGAIGIGLTRCLWRRRII